MNDEGIEFIANVASEPGRYQIARALQLDRGDTFGAVSIELLFDAFGFDMAIGIPSRFWLVQDHSRGILRFDNGGNSYIDGRYISIWQEPAPILRRHAGRWLSIEIAAFELDFWLSRGVESKKPYRIDYWADGQFVKAGRH